MIPPRSPSRVAIGLVVLALVHSASAFTTLLDDDFNDGNLSTNPDTGGGFIDLGNGANVAGSVTESGSQARILDGTVNNTYGILSSNAFDLSNASLTHVITWEVANWTSSGAGTGQRRAFFTLQTNDSWIFGGGAEESRMVIFIDELNDNARVRYQNRSGGSNTNFDSTTFGLGTFDEDTDGFTATLVMDSTGFSFSTVGLAATNEISIADTWANIGTDFATVLGTDGPMHVAGFIQDTGATGSSLDLDRVTVTSVPEPSGVFLLGLSCGIVACFRRRH